MAEYQVLSNGKDDGTIICSTTSQKLSIFAGTPVARQTLTAAAVATTVSVSTTTGAITSWGFSTSTQANAIISLVNELRADLVLYGLVA